MSASNFSACLAFTLLQEGGYANNPNDPGGCTMEGITLATYQSWKKNTTLTCSDLQNISSTDVSTIYQQNYWNLVQGNSLPAGVDLMTFDMAVNAGVNASAKLLQAALGVTVDGDIGPLTLASVTSANAVTLINGLAQHQSTYYKSLSGFQYFGTGWLNRVNARQTSALSMVAGAAPIVQVASAPQRVAVTDVPPTDFYTWLKSVV